MVKLAGYELQTEIHTSPTTRVFRGRRLSDGTRVIVKVASSDRPTLKQRARWRYEHELLTSVQGPGIVRAVALEEKDDVLALVLADGGGTSLRSRLGKPLAPKEFLDLAIRMADALRTVHDAHVVHKDICPANIVVVPETGAVELIDFGIASRLTREAQELRSPNLLEGTLAYMAPEQTGRMNRAIDARSDLYALGMTFFEMLAGETAFSATDPLEMVHAHIAKTPPPLREKNPAVPEALARVVEKLLAKSAEDRYQSAHGLRADLETCRAGLGSPSALVGFVPGRSDVGSQLRIPEKLYGRDEDVARLAEGVKRASHGKSELFVVSGYSGIGKSSLVHEAHGACLEHHAYFAGGKFEQFKRDIPFDGVLQALRALFQQVLLEPEGRVATFRAALAEALGLSAHVLTTVVPELELILGKQPPAPDVGPGEAQARFYECIEKVAAAFASLGHPLVLFLDDVQWADPASLGFLEFLGTTPRLERLLTILAYRDNEVSPTHPLSLVMERIDRAAQVRIERFAMMPLARPWIRKLVADTVHRDDADVDALAELIEAKTLGNPFFVNQLITELHRDGLLTFSHVEGRWRWDLEAIRGARLGDNVVELMVGSLRKLPAETRMVLELAACAGNRFDLAVLAVVAERSARDVASALWPALEQGHVLPLDDQYRVAGLVAAEGEASAGYRFAHDRVQQAAFAMIPEADRRAVRLRMGRLMLGKLTGEALEARAFEILEHVEGSKDALTLGGERQRVAELALVAGRKARAATAYDVGVRALRFGKSLLPADAWSTSYALTLGLHLEKLQCEYLAGDFEAADATFRETIAHAQSNLDKAGAYRVRITLDENAGRFAEGLKLGLECLRGFGIEMDADPSDAVVQGLVGDVKRALGSRSVRDLIDAPPMNDLEQLARTIVLLSMIPPAFFCGINIFRAVAARLALISVEHGNMPYSAAAYVMFGVVLAEIGEHSLGYDYGKLAYDMLERADNPDIRGKVLFLFGDWLNFRKHHIRTDEDYLLRAFQACVQVGDVTYASYCCNHLLALWFVVGRRLDESHAEAANWHGFCLKVKALEMADACLAIDRAFATLLGLTKSRSTYSDDQGFDEAVFEKRVLEERSPNVQAWHYHHRAWVHYLFEEWDAARAAGRESDLRTWAVHGHMHLEEHALFWPLILAAAPPETPEARAADLAVMRANRDKLAVLATAAPMNYEHKRLLVEAEIARVEGDAARAAELYDEALASAMEHGYVNNAAVAAECAARFYLARGHRTRARAYLLEAREQYARWGAEAKVQQLEEKYGRLLGVAMDSASAARGPRDTITSTSYTLDGAHGLDMLTVTKASQAISSEIHRDRLLEQMMRIVLENAGAERGYLVLLEGSTFVLGAAGSAGSERVDLLVGRPLGGATGLSEAVVHYVARTDTPVVLAHACKEGTFVQDPHIAKNGVKSVLCIPAKNQGKLVGILYLENNLAEGAFTVDRLEVLRILSTQIAISIENASLYAHLEDKVRERTEQLRAAQSRLLAMEKAATERQMAGGFAHEMRNVLAGPRALLSQALGLEGAGAGHESLPAASARALQELHALVDPVLSPEAREKSLALMRTIFANDEYLDEMLGIVRKAVERGLGITHQILEYARTGQERVKLSKVDLNSVIQDLRREHEREFEGQGVKLQLVLDPSAGEVFALETHVQSVVKNIVLNARDALLGRDAALGERTITVVTKQENGRVCFSVEDNGVGIAPDHKARIFEPFFSTKPDTGTGLGLALVRKIVTICDGDIAVESEVGRGTRIDVFLPMGQLAADANGRTQPS